MRKITIFDHNKPGILADITSLLDQAKINIENIDAFTLKGYGFVSLSVDKFDDALHILKNAGWQAVIDPVILLLLQDKPGALAVITNRFKTADINLESIRILKRIPSTGFALVGMTAAAPSDEIKSLVKHNLVENHIAW